METNTKEEKSAEKDTITIAVLISVALVVFAFWVNISWILNFATIMLVGLSLAIGSLGRQRRIGFGPSYFLSLLLSPIIGMVFTLISPRIKDEEYKEKMLEMTLKSSAGKTGSVADELHKLNELRKEGALTDEEFNVQKERLLHA